MGAAMKTQRKQPAKKFFREGTGGLDWEVEVDEMLPCSGKEPIGGRHSVRTRSRRVARRRTVTFRIVRVERRRVSVEEHCHVGVVNGRV